MNTFHKISIFYNSLIKKKGLIILIILLALFSRFEYVVFNFPFHTDEQYQVLSTIYMQQGKGLTLSYVDRTDVSKSKLKPFTRPSGYNYMFSPILKLTNSIYWSIVIFKSIGILILFFSWYLIYIYTKKFISKKYIIPLLLILGFNNFPFMDYGTTDLLAISFLWLAFSSGIAFFISQKKLVFLLLSTVALFSGFWVRDAYLPLLFVFPFSFLLTILIEKKKKYFSYFLLMLSILIFLMLLKSNFTVSLPKTGNTSVYYFKNLLNFNYFFPLQTLIDERLFYSILNKLHLNFIINPVKLLLSLFIVSLLIYLTIINLRNLIKQKVHRQNTFVWLLPLLVSGVTLVMLLFLSVKTHEQTTDLLTNWTFVQEIRYFAPIFMSILLLIIYFGFGNKILLQQKKAKKILRFIVYISAILSVFYLLPSKYSKIKLNKNYFLIGNEKLYSQTIGNIKDGELLNKLIEKSTLKGVRPIYITTDQSKIMSEIMGAEFGGAIFDAQWNDLKTSKDVILILRLTKNSYYKKKENKIQQFCIENGKKETEFKEIEVYTYKLKAN